MTADATRRSANWLRTRLKCWGKHEKRNLPNVLVAENAKAVKEVTGKNRKCMQETRKGRPWVFPALYLIDPDQEGLKGKGTGRKTET